MGKRNICDVKGCDAPATHSFSEEIVRDSELKDLCREHIEELWGEEE